MSDSSITLKRLLRMIHEYTEEHGFPPTIREIMEVFDVRSTSTVHRYLNVLQDQGRIVREPGKTRAIRIVPLDDDEEEIHGEAAHDDDVRHGVMIEWCLAHDRTQHECDLAGPGKDGTMVCYPETVTVCVASIDPQWVKDRLEQRVRSWLN